jgi:hypothetical protein
VGIFAERGAVEFDLHFLQVVHVVVDAPQEEVAIGLDAHGGVGNGDGATFPIFIDDCGIFGARGGLLFLRKLAESNVDLIEKERDELARDAVCVIQGRCRSRHRTWRSHNNVE